MKKLVSLLLALAMLSCVTAAFAETLSGKAYGFANGVIEVSLTLEDGKIRRSTSRPSCRRRRSAVRRLTR